MSQLPQVTGERLIRALTRLGFALPPSLFPSPSHFPADLHAFLKLPCFEDWGEEPALGELVEIVVGLDEA